MRAKVAKGNHGCHAGKRNENCQEQRSLLEISYKRRPLRYGATNQGLLVGTPSGILPMVSKLRVKRMPLKRDLKDGVHFIQLPRRLTLPIIPPIGCVTGEGTGTAGYTERS